MTATVPAARKQVARVMRNIEVESPTDSLRIVRFVVAEGRSVESYAVIHWTDSLEVRVCHRDDPKRAYTVTCSAVDGRPTRCTCPAATFRGTGCRHRAAVAKLTDLGVMRMPVLEDAGHDRESCE